MVHSPLIVWHFFNIQNKCIAALFYDFKNFSGFKNHLNLTTWSTQVFFPNKKLNRFIEIKFQQPNKLYNLFYFVSPLYIIKTKAHLEINYFDQMVNTRLLEGFTIHVLKICFFNTGITYRYLYIFLVGYKN